MTKKQRALEVIERLKKEYPDAGCTLDYDQAWKLLVSVRLAAHSSTAVTTSDQLSPPPPARSHIAQVSTVPP